MKQIVIDRALNMEVGEVISLSFDTYPAARSFQSGISSALGKVPPKLRGTLLMALHNPGSVNNLSEKYVITLEKVDTYSNATITLKDGTTMNLIEYDYKLQQEEGDDR